MRRCLKISLHSLLSPSHSSRPILDDAVHRSTLITSKSYLLLRSLFLNRYHHSLPLPPLTQHTILNVIRFVCSSSSHPNQELHSLYSSSFEDGSHLSQVLKYYSITILTSITNNIRFHFLNHLRHYIHHQIRNSHQDVFEHDRPFFHRLVRCIYNDILMDKKKSPPEYHNWIDEKRSLLIPPDWEVALRHDQGVFLSPMIYMALENEKIGIKVLQVFPLQKGFLSKAIQIDTTSMIDLFIPQNEKSTYRKDVMGSKDVIWSRFFDLSPYKIKDHVFDSCIITDGYSVSLRFLPCSKIEKENVRKTNMKKARMEMRSLTPEQREEQRMKKKEQAKERYRQFKRDQQKKDSTSTTRKKSEKDEFPYIDDINPEVLNGNVVVIDPGKRSLLTMMDRNGRFLSYTNREHMRSNYRLHYQEKTRRNREKLEIIPLEKTFNECSSRSCDPVRWKKYREKWEEVYEELFRRYEEKSFRQYRWYSHIQKKRTGDKLLNKIRSFYGEDAVLVMGDWGQGKQMKGFISTPGIGLKRKLKEKFQVYDVDEYKTSCIHHMTKEKCENLKLGYNGKIRRLHAVLTYKMEKNRMGCMNRDKNGCMNMMRLVEARRRGEERPEELKRQNVLTVERPSNRTKPIIENRSQERSNESELN